MGIIGEAKIKLLQIKALFSQDKLSEGIEQGLILLEKFGMVFPKKNVQLYAVAMLLRMEVGLNKAAIIHAQKKPNTSNPHINMIVEILGAISVPIFYANPKFYLLTLLAQIKICLAHGITPTSPYVFASYGAILSSRLGKFARAAQFAQLATVLQENQENKIGKCRTDFVVSAMIDPWNKNIHDILPALYNNYHLALQSGDAEFAESSIQAYTYYSLFAGKNLDALITDITTYFSRKDQIIRPSIQLGISLLKKGIGYLTDSLPSEEQIEPVFFSSEDFNNMKADKMSKVLMFQYCSLQIRLAVQFNRPLLALRYIAALKPHLSSYQGLFGFTSYCFYESLALMFLVKTMSPRRRYQALRNVKKNQRNFEKWMKSCPTNFSHLWHLVEAEICKFRNQEKQALFHYEEAIRMAKLNNFSNVVALAQELLGEFYVQRGYEFSGVTCLIESQHQYIKWGAKAKVEHIQRKYPHLYGLKNISKDLRSISPQTELQHGFDVITLLKATQTLSQEIILSKLLKRLVAIVVENSGAQKALLLLKQDNSWTIEAYKKSADSPIEVIYDTYLDTNTLGNEYIPISLFNYVVQSKTSAIIGNAVEDSIVMQDYYVEKNLSKSLLLTPMFYQGNLIGLVFLETNLGTYIFNQNHLEILHIISAQAAISIENARLYANMEKRIAERTQQIKELSYIDSLTNVPNRKAFDEKVTEEFERAKRSYQPLSILIIDIDHFKKVNDTYGHLAGDECLKLMGTTLTELKKRTTDFVARYGGEEFIFILPLTDLPGAIDFAQGILRAVQQIVFKIGDITHPITVSIGVACKNKDNNIEPKDLISLADKSLYIAKEQGRNRVVSS